MRGATDPGFRPSHPGMADPLVGTVVSGRFRVDDLIGQGGMGKVYRARHLALERTVVLKMLKPQLLEDPTLVGRFEREAKAASRLNHPNVIQVLDFGRLENDGTLYIVMEHVQGKDLRLVLRDDWPLAEERLCNIMAQVCSALGEAHVNDVIHRSRSGATSPTTSRCSTSASRRSSARTCRRWPGRGSSASPTAISPG